jgi:hypothetical protein
VVAILAVFVSRSNVQRQIQVAAREAWMREFREQVAAFIRVEMSLRVQVMRSVEGDAYDDETPYYAILHPALECPQHLPHWLAPTACKNRARSGGSRATARALNPAPTSVPANGEPVLKTNAAAGKPAGYQGSGGALG